MNKPNLTSEISIGSIGVLFAIVAASVTFYAKTESDAADFKRQFADIDISRTQGRIAYDKRLDGVDKRLDKLETHNETAEAENTTRREAFINQLASLTAQVQFMVEEVKGLRAAIEATRHAEPGGR